MADICEKIPQDAKKIISEKCRVVNICAFISPGVEITKNTICKQIQKANDIWCGCGIMFNLTKIKNLADVVNNPGDFDFDASEIDSAKDFFNQMQNYPTAEKLYNLKPCCSDGPHVTLHYIKGIEFNSHEKGAGSGNDNTKKYFIMMTTNTPDTLLAHELGHCLGLDHVTDVNNVMFPKPPGTKTTNDQCLQINGPERRSPLIQEEYHPVSFITEFPKRFEIEIVNMTVDKVNDGADPEDDIEIKWNFKIDNTGNGTSTILSWEHHQIEDDDPNVPYHIGVRTIVVVDKDTDIVRLNISGVEFDPGDDDTLPSRILDFDKTNNWGTIFPSPISLSNSEITCNIALKVTELPSTPQPIPRFCNKAII